MRASDGLTQRHPKTNTQISFQVNEEKVKKSQSSDLIEILIPFLIAGFGMVFAGLIFKKVQTWDLYMNITEIVILVPALLGLKGNLEMTLAARLSTQVNLGLIYDRESELTAAFGNIALTQVQSIVVGFLASLVACITSFFLEGRFNSEDIFILFTSSVTTASLASLLLGSIVIFIIITAKKFNINPDNIATPIAASLGDAVTLIILSLVGTFFYTFRKTLVIHVSFMVLFILMVPFLAFYCNKNKFVNETLHQGWLPIIIAMLISSTSGIILERAIKVYKDIAVYQPVVNGIGGNLVAIYASRLSTVLFETSEMGTWATWSPESFYLFPKEAFLGAKNPESKTALMLSSMILPGHLIFFFAIFFVDSFDNTNSSLSIVLIILYLFFATLQVLILLVLCYYCVHLMWKLRNNPDNFCIPLLTGFGDFLGVIFLFLCFHLVFKINGVV